jgi:Ca2+-binding RTX toxin-like protein
MDWEVGDSLHFSTVAGTSANYVEVAADNVAAAATLANERIAAGVVDYVAVGVGGNVVVYADSHGDNGSADFSVTLVGRGLNDISFENIVGGPRPVAPGTPVPPAPAPAQGGTPGAQGTIMGDMDAQHLSNLLGATINEHTPTLLSLTGATYSLGLSGSNLTYDSNAQLTDGQVFRLNYGVTSGPGFFSSLLTPNISASQFGRWVATDATQEAFSTILAWNDTLGGGGGDDLIRGYDGNDRIYGAGGADSLYGGAGNDAIYAIYPPGMGGGSGVGATYLRGDEGNDVIVGGPSFDDINGNMGDDTASGGLGDDWVVGGKDNDRLSGEGGSDIVYGNIGNDTCDGGAGNDVVRGGQDNDSVSGGIGDDYVSGDKGDDTVSGGFGADVFHTFSGAGLDRVIDFTPAEGDRVMVDPGTAYTLSQVGADTVIDMGGGHQMILVGVQLSTLTPGWIFGA